MAGQDMTQGRDFGAGRMGALERLVELLRIAQEDQVPGGRGDRYCVGERQLAGLVDDEHIHGRGKLGARP